jgi:hypothetical protein
MVSGKSEGKYRNVQLKVNASTARIVVEALSTS